MEQAANKPAAGAAPDPRLDHVRVRATAERTVADKRKILLESGPGWFSVAICAPTAIVVAAVVALATAHPIFKPLVWAALAHLGLHP